LYFWRRRAHYRHRQEAEEGANMKKRIAVVATVCVVMMLGVGAAAFAGVTVLSPNSVRPGSTPDGTQAKGAVTVGSQWTLYTIQFDGSNNYGFGPCEVLTFQSHGTFTGDQGDVGRWSKNIKLTFTNGSFFWPGTFSAKYVSNLGEDGPGFQGDDETGAAWAGIGPLRLYQNPISGGPTC
jgi:hypothetical protein